MVAARPATVVVGDRVTVVGGAPATVVAGDLTAVVVGDSGVVVVLVTTLVVLLTVVAVVETIRALRWLSGTRSKATNAAPNTTSAALTARCSPWTPGVGRARKVTAIRKPIATSASGSVQRKVRATPGASAEPVCSDPIGSKCTTPNLLESERSAWPVAATHPMAQTVSTGSIRPWDHSECHLAGRGGGEPIPPGLPPGGRSQHSPNIRYSRP
jgi:hypothetical protein